MVVVYPLQVLITVPSGLQRGFVFFPCRRHCICMIAFFCFLLVGYFCYLLVTMFLKISISRHLRRRLLKIPSVSNLCQDMTLLILAIWQYLVLFFGKFILIDLQAMRKFYLTLKKAKCFLVFCFLTFFQAVCLCFLKSIASMPNVVCCCCIRSRSKSVRLLPHTRDILHCDASDDVHKNLRCSSSSYNTSHEGNQD